MIHNILNMLIIISLMVYTSWTVHNMTLDILVYNEMIQYNTFGYVILKLWIISYMIIWIM